MDPRLRPGTDDDLDGIWDVFRLAFGFTAADRQRWMFDVDPARCLVVDGPRGEIAAASRVLPFRQWFGGRAVSLGGYSPVAVQAEHRGRGLGRAITAGHFADLRDRGEVIAGLFPSSVALYRSVGFELAGSYVHRRLRAADVGAVRPGRPVDVRRGSIDDLAAVHRCHLRLGPNHDGTLVRSEGWWARRFDHDLSTSVLYVVDAAEPGELDGYSVHRLGSTAPPYDYTVVVSEVVADDPDVYRALWRVVGSSGSQAPDVNVVGAAEDRLFLVLGGADPTSVRSEIRWMLRLVDAPGAVAARGWRPSVRGTVDLAVVDEHAPWNTGRWVLTVEDGHGRLEPGGDGTVEATIGGLSSWWSGYASARRLATTGHLRSADPAALGVLDDLGATSPPTLVDFY